MSTNTLLNSYKPLSRIFIPAILYLLFSSFNDTQTSIHSQTAITDTVPANELANLTWNNVNKLVPGNGVLIMQMNDGNNLLIRRNDYEQYARQTAKSDDYDKTFTKLEIEPEFPGGDPAWLRYAGTNMRYPKEAAEGKIQGAVVVQFIVDTDGNLHEVAAISGPTQGGLRDEAERLVSTSGKWNCGIQNFRLVKAYKKQLVRFSLDQK